MNTVDVSSPSRPDDQTETSSSAKAGHSASGVIPGEVGVWIFIIGDLLMFSLLFGVFLFYRAEDPATFLAGKGSLQQGLALANTILLLTSSWLVVRGLTAYRSDDRTLSIRFFLAAIACGAGFVAIKYFEYNEKFSSGITIDTNNFYTYYFVLTGIHLIHVLVGLMILYFVTRVAAKPDPTPSDLGMVESGCLYWHMVDLLWIVILAVIYLI